jgi:hypothetical protein
MQKKISYHSNDVLLKSLSELYRNQVLTVYQLDYPKIVDVLPNNFPQMKVDERRADNIFLLEDESILLLEYETNNRVIENHLKYSEYVLRIVDRYYNERKQIKKVHVAVIYSSDIKPDFHLLDMGSMFLETKAVSLRHFDGDHILKDIKSKIEHGNFLVKEDIMKLILVPLMRSNQDRQMLIKQSIEIAKEIQNDYEQIAVIVGILTATDKIIDEEYSKSVREWLRMTKVEKIYQQEKELALQEQYNELARVKQQEKEKALQEQYNELARVKQQEKEKALQEQYAEIARVKQQEKERALQEQYAEIARVKQQEKEKALQEQYNELARVKQQEKEKALQEQYAEIARVKQQEKEKALQEQAYEMAKKMLTNLEINIEKIAQITGLSVEEVKKIKSRD